MAVRVYLAGMDADEDGAMKFRLTYQGPLLAENNRGGANPLRADAKQKIRKHFHKQLKRLWLTHPVLGDHPDEPKIVAHISRKPIPQTIGEIADSFRINGYRYVPLATRDLGVLVGLDILFLRNDPPGAVVHAGDIDNRVKTLVDALKMPNSVNELGSFTTPDQGENPFFVLMEDDSLVSRLSVETDTLLDPIDQDVSTTRVVITVNVTPYRTNVQNVHLGG